MVKKTGDARIEAITNLSRSGKIEEAKEKCLQYISNPIFLSMYIKLLIQENNIDEAKKLCLENLDDPFICSQYLYILIGENRYEEARSICEKYSDEETLNPQYLRILNHFKDYDKIEEIVRTYPYNFYVNKSYVFSLVEQGRFKRAREVCKRFAHYKDVVKLNELIEKNEVKGENLTNSEVFFDVLDLIKQGDMKEAKSLCMNFLEDKKIFNLYIMILEKERIKSRKKLLFKNK